MKDVSFLVLLFCVFSISGHAHAAGPSTRLGCYKALAEASWIPNYTLSESGTETVLVPTTRDGKKGFYLYLPTTAYFYAIPETRDGAVETPEFVSYAFELAILGQHSIYLNYSQFKDPKKVATPAIVANTFPFDSFKNKYISLRGVEVQDEQANQAFNQQLESRIRSVTTTYHTRITRLNDGGALLSAKDSALNALATCEAMGDAQIRGMVVAERGRLEYKPSGNRGLASEKK